MTIKIGIINETDEKRGAYSITGNDRFDTTNRFSLPPALPAFVACEKVTLPVVIRAWNQAMQSAEEALR